MKGASRIYAGQMVGIGADDLARQVTATPGLRIVGRAESNANNLAGADGAIRIGVATGIFRFANASAADLIALHDIGATCFAVDASTVAKTDGGGTRSAAGTVYDVDSGGVWVRFV